MKSKLNVTNFDKFRNPQLWVDINQTEQECLSGGTGLTHTVHTTFITPAVIIPIRIRP
jgi:hypothetical protein